MIQGRLLSDCRVNSPFYKFDHVFPGLPNEGPLVILYGELGTPDLNKFHALLVEKASSGQIQYIFRHHVKVCVSFVFAFSIILYLVNISLL